MGPQTSTFVRAAPLAMLVMSLCFVSLASLTRLVDERRALHDPKREEEREVLYLPNGDALEFASFGYRNVVGDVLWFRTISYFGKHLASDRNYRWLNHMCDLVTAMTPRAVHPYLFCSNMLAWEANSPADSLRLLDRAVVHLPENWHLRYYRGMMHLAFLKQPAAALEDFRAASRLPGAHPLVKRLAAKTIAEIEDPRSAIEFLNEMVEREQDPSARRVLKERRQELLRKAAHP